MNNLDIKKDVFDYSDLGVPISNFLQQKENNIKNATGQAYTKIGMELNEARDKLAGNNQYNGYFEKWIEFLGLKRDTVYRLINRYKLVIANCDEQNIIEELPLSLSYETAKPSVDKGLKKEYWMERSLLYKNLRS